MHKSINIEIISDFACPWCLVGKRRLENAIAQRPLLDICVKWRPFQLNPDMPRQGRNRREYYSDKFGVERAKSLRESLLAVGAEEGIVFGDEPNAIAPNTLSAHVLMYWAHNGETVDTNSLAEKLFVAHHVACENIGDIDVLARIAGEVGMNAIHLRSMLEAGDDEEAVKRQIRQSSADGISGVPFFTLNGEYGVSGAQPAETFVSAFDQIQTDDK